MKYDLVTKTGKNHLIRPWDGRLSRALCNQKAPAGTGWPYRLPWDGDTENLCMKCQKVAGAR